MRLVWTEIALKIFGQSLTSGAHILSCVMSGQFFDPSNLIIREKDFNCIIQYLCKHVMCILFGSCIIFIRLTVQWITNTLNEEANY